MLIADRDVRTVVWKVDIEHFDIPVVDTDPVFGLQATGGRHPVFVHIAVPQNIGEAAADAKDGQTKCLQVQTVR